MGKSSKDKRDIYYRLAKEQGWRARSAFKLLQLDEEFDLFKDVTRVVDLCAAPGSWSQVLSRVLIKGEKFGRRAWDEKLKEIQVMIQEAMEEGDEEDFEAPLAIERSTEKPKADMEVGTSATEKTNYEDKEKRQQQQQKTEEAESNSEVSPTPRADIAADTLPSEPRPVTTATTNSDTNALNATPTGKQIRIVAIDLQPISPLPGITTIRADITHPSTVPALLHALDPDTFSLTDPSHLSDPTKSTPVDLILSDGAPDVTGLHDFDIYIQSQLLYSALNLAIRVLKPGGKFVAKIFRAKDVDLIYAQLRILFGKVTVAKPRSSRASSLEAFVVCEGFAPPGGLRDVVLGVGEGLENKEKRKKTEQKRWEREDGVTVLELASDDEEEIDLGEEDDERTQARKHAARYIVPFLACGDLNSPDADATYKLPEGYKSLDPVQPPTAPPYKKALEMRRAAGGAYGKTKHQA